MTTTPTMDASGSLAVDERQRDADAQLRRTSPSHTSYERPPLVVVAAGIVAFVLVEVLAWFLLRSQGVSVTGDSPNYIIAAEALAHLHLDPVPYYRHDLVTHGVFAWAPGATIQSSGAQIYPGPHGPMPAHGIGLSVLMAPAILVAKEAGALLWVMVLMAAGLAFVHQRVSQVAGLGRRAQVILALAMGPPALVLASTQVYPDLLAGVLAACAFVELAYVERRRRMGPLSVVILTIVLVTLPWLEIKNVTLVAIGLLALLVIWLRIRTGLLPLGIVVGAAVASGGLLVAFNEYFYAHAVGLPESPERITATAILHMAALVLDRHQGLFVQVPTVLLGILGLWFARRTAPVSAVASLVGAAAIIGVNGAYQSQNWTGGVSLAGRFEWTAAPILLGWSAFLLRAIPRRRLLPLGATVLALWVWQAVPLVLADHTYFNATFSPFLPWDPRLYPGWWPGVNGLLPVFVDVSANRGTFVVHVLAEVVVLVGAGALLVAATRKRLTLRRVATVVVGTGAATAVLAAEVVALVPTAPISWAGATLGSPWTAATTGRYVAPLPLLEVGQGTYELQAVTVGGAPVKGRSGAHLFAMLGTASRGRWAGWLTLRHPTDAALLRYLPPRFATSRTIAKATVASGSAASRTVSMRFTVTQPQELLVAVSVPSGVALSLSRLTLTQVTP